MVNRSNVIRLRNTMPTAECGCPLAKQRILKWMSWVWCPDTNIISVLRQLTRKESRNHWKLWLQSSPKILSVSLFNHFSAFLRSLPVVSHLFQLFSSCSCSSAQSRGYRLGSKLRGTLMEGTQFRRRSPHNRLYHREARQI